MAPLMKSSVVLLLHLQSAAFAAPLAGSANTNLAQAFLSPFLNNLLPQIIRDAATTGQPTTEKPTLPPVLKGVSRNIEAFRSPALLRLFASTPICSTKSTDRAGVVDNE